MRYCLVAFPGSELIGFKGRQIEVDHGPQVCLHASRVLCLLEAIDLNALFLSSQVVMGGSLVFRAKSNSANSPGRSRAKDRRRILMFL